MNLHLQRALLMVAGIAFACALYILPDMLVNLGETVSFWMKTVWAIVLLIVSIAAVRTKQPAIASFTIAACAALLLLLAFGSVIRLNELGL